MQVLMGGSGSTGSSLLKNILNRHQDIFSGEETTFFAKKMIYDDWSKAKNRVLKKKFFGLRNHGWHLFNGTKLLHKEYQWTKEELKQLIQKSQSLLDFAKVFYARPLESKGARIWLEKTPANAACFSFFLSAFPEGRVIHITRNPYDTIASLCSRGYGLYYAIGIYLLNTACGLEVMGEDRVFTAKYEDLTSYPENVVENLCDFLAISFDPEMLLPQGETVKKPKLSGWNYDETKAIEKGAVGRFNKLDENSKAAILGAVNRICISKVGQEYYQTKISSIKDICSELEYDYYEADNRSILRQLKKERRSDRWNRIRRGYPTGNHYPLEIKS